MEGFSGPIPPPSTLKEYEAAHTGLAERIVTMAENEQNHRHSMDKLVVNSTVIEKKRGQIFGLSLGICGILVAGVLGLWGSATVGSIIGGASLVSLVAVFVIGKKLEKISNQEQEADES